MERRYCRVTTCKNIIPTQHLKNNHRNSDIFSSVTSDWRDTQFSRQIYVYWATWWKTWVNVYTSCHYHFQTLFDTFYWLPLSFLNTCIIVYIVLSRDTVVVYVIIVTCLSALQTLPFTSENMGRLGMCFSSQLCSSSATSRCGPSSVGLNLAREMIIDIPWTKNHLVRMLLF